MAKKRILLLSDDLRMSSGVGTMSREFVMGTLHHYDWVQVAGAIKHPEAGKFIDMNEIVRKETGVKDASLKIVPTNGYGDAGLIRHLISTEKIDAILHYTDPRFWEWLYQMEHEIRMQIPIFYYNIWDDLPYPIWNEPFYESCDLIMNISKQTVNIVDNVRKKVPTNDWNNTYLPHGINEVNFYPIGWDHKHYAEMLKFRNEILDGAEKDFVVFWNNRNIRRKLPGDVVEAYKLFCDMLPKEQADKCVLIMHTQPIDVNGTDLPAVAAAVCPDYDVVFSGKKLDDKHLNFLYNIGDVAVNMASNEGFGLTTCEALMCGTPISVNVTGGLQDQCGFKYKGEFLTYKDYSWIHSLHDEKKWKDNEDLTWGEWAKPVWPSNRSLQGSVQTPFIYDDRPRAGDFADALKEWYDMEDDKRKECGNLGHEFVMGDDSMMSAKAMSNNFISHMDTALEKWTKRKRFTIFNTSEAI